MKILVDEIPVDSKECSFSTGDTRYCTLDKNYKCNNTDVCPFLDPITKYEAVSPMPGYGENIYIHIPIERQ